MKKLGLSLIVVLLAACQTQPTKVYQSTKPKAKATVAATDNGPYLELNEKTVLIDARAPFDYSVAHLNGAINVRWEDFTQKEKPFIGLLELDHFAITRRLARLGIDPETPVIVVGKALEGQAEEWRVAWTLQYLGVKNVKVSSLDYFSLPMSTSEAPPRENKAIWKPQYNASLIVDKNEFLKESVKPEAQRKVKVIDVRTESEYLGKSEDSLSRKAPDIGAVNVPWTEFFDKMGFVNPHVVQKLSIVGVTPKTKLYIISNKGVRSAAVTLALKELGFEQVANFAGGYQQLVFEPGFKKSRRR